MLIKKKIKDCLSDKFKFINFWYIFNHYYFIQTSPYYNGYTKKTLIIWLGFAPFLTSFLILLVFGENTVKIPLDVKSIIHLVINIIFISSLKESTKSNLLTSFSILTGFLFNAIVLLLTLKFHKNEKIRKIWEVLLASILYLMAVSLFILILLVFDIWDFLAVFLVFHFFFCFANTLRQFYVYVLSSN
ncbi:hypothetical protein JH146_0859 [Methanocaldococcus bathoardescens]|uniref:Uncharacterized protein n=1 Tax=Methanocaldococcus bathoardescens TaxID=1301915 RepID=A0A076LJG5_9EURY|nr:hypothetical protein [Methanocaldococcus bathoardescens]AIJ05704.1 hypothetical protein JH146_0859 [Methanocaldococcus bathoardescens]